jgi:hypothetical protein
MSQLSLVQQLGQHGKVLTPTVKEKKHKIDVTMWVIQGRQEMGQLSTGLTIRPALRHQGKSLDASWQGHSKEVTEIRCKRQRQRP